MPFKQLIKKIQTQPRKLFVIDGLGAITSAFLLGIVLVNFESMFGIPASTLYFLAALPVFFAGYDFYCYKNVNDDFALPLKRIAGMNLLYCLLSFGMASYHRETLTLLGWSYILIELMIVFSLAITEWRTAKLKIRRAV